MADDGLGVDPEYQIPDELWERIRPLTSSAQTEEEARPSPDG